MSGRFNRRKVQFLVLLGLTLLAGIAVPGQEKPKHEIIQATARGQVRGPARLFNVTITIESYSTPEDQKTLIDAFQGGGHDGLVKALRGMKSRGKVAITGTTGYAIAYVRANPKQGGRTIRLITDRPIQFTGEYQGNRMFGYDLSGIELNIAAEPEKSEGSLVVAGRMKIENQQISFESYGAGPWRLADIRER